MTQANDKREGASGRTELAQRYFPNICPRAAWHKLRLMMLEHDSLSTLATMPRRTFTPAEVGRIIDILGRP